VAKKTTRHNPRSNAEILMVLMLPALSVLPDSAGIDPFLITQETGGIGVGIIAG
jgi:hypothetical protein